jgi:hypothetical protein
MVNGLKVKVGMEEVMEKMTLEVDVVRTRMYRLRFWIGTLLLRLGVRALGCGIRFKENKDAR